MDDPRDLGLFPLGLVLLPGERAPLHVFEQRYRQLVADCVLAEEPFVVAMADDTGVARVGCTARVERLLQRFEDGRMNIQVVGVDPVAIVEETSGRLYFSTLVRGLLDVDEPPPTELETEVLNRFRALAEQIIGAPTEPTAPAGTPTSYAVAGAVELPDDAKQELLEMRSEAERLDRVNDLLADARIAIDRQKIAAERAQRNGKVIAS